MGHLFTRMATVSLEEQNSSLTRENNLMTFKPSNFKRKRTDHDIASNKRKIVINLTSNDDNERLSLSPRIPPIISNSSNVANRSLQSITLFKCQLCRRCLRNKDIYMDHMILCSIQRQASVKIVRAKSDKDKLSIL